MWVGREAALPFRICAIVEGICAFFSWNWAIRNKSTKFATSVKEEYINNFRHRTTSNLLCDSPGGHFVCAITEHLFSGDKGGQPDKLAFLVTLPIQYIPHCLLALYTYNHIYVFLCCAWTK